MDSKEAFMRTVRVFEALSFVVPLALYACGGDKNREADSPSTTVTYEPAPTVPYGMKPASGVTETERPAASSTEPAPTTDPQTTAPDLPRAAPLTDEQIAAIIDAANGAEVDAARLALQESKNPRVKKFAQKMIDHHGKAKQDQSKLLSKLGMTPAESTKQKDLKTSAADTERTLKSASSALFDKVYIDIQVADHQMVLDSLDRELIPSVKNAELKKSLEDFRPKVAAHLEEALEIQKALMSTPAKTGASGATGSKSPSKDASKDTTSGPMLK
jgi:putative membrane protein